MPWGTHFCHFYQTRQDLLHTVVPYLKAGLESNEFAMWVTVRPLSQRARSILRRAIPGIAGHVAAGDLQVVPYTQWYLRSDGTFDPERVIAGWNRQLARALDTGYAGLRVIADEAWLGTRYWHAFSEYEQMLSEPIASQRMLVMCAYPLASTAAGAIFDVAHTHQFATAERRGTWQTLETPDLKHAKVELKRLNEELALRADAERQAREAAEAANRTKSEFLARMSHELRSPLNTVLGFSRLMARDPELPPTAREDLDLILSSGEYLHALINQVLDLSKLEAGGAAVNEAELDLGALLDNLRETFGRAAERKGLLLVVDADPALPLRVRGDPLKLRQVLVNLIDNALKFTQRGRITVRAEVDTTDGSPGRLAFAVADTGPGIARAEIEALFSPFVQAEAGKRAQEGTGLGLAISRGLVRVMGGDIRMDSEVDRGTTVRFDIPLHLTDVPASADAVLSRRAIGLAPGEPRYRLLVVDDQPASRRLLLRLLEPLGFELREAGTGQEALALWHNWRPHLIWMDSRMPVLDGREATRRIRASVASLPAGEHTPLSSPGAQEKGPVIIALTASSFEESQPEFLAAGFDDVLSKPFREADLFALLEKHLGVHFVPEELPASPPPLDADALRALPESLRAPLAQALVQLDTTAVDRAIDAIGRVDRRIAEALTVWAADFQYERILSSIGALPTAEKSADPAPAEDAS